MRLHVVLLTALLLASSSAIPAESKPGRAADAAGAFARLKTLAGEWKADTKMGKAHITYEVIAGGTTLVERETIEGMAPMLTVYHLDGDRLLLTHYCMAGNQPRMQAKTYNADAGEIQFAFLDATNLKPGAGHMRDAKFRISENTKEFESEWTFHENGQPKSTERAQYTRVK
jgi:hypothetical protein